MNHRPTQLKSRINHLKRVRQRGLAKNHRLYIERLEDRRMLAGDGLQAQYFNTDDLSGPALVRVDSAIDFNWGAASPDASIAADTFSARWNGQIESQFTETHTFYVNANDGARLWINGVLLIDQLDSPLVFNASANIDLIAGRRYDIQFEYRENTGGASAKLEWDSASLAREVVPTSQLFSGHRGSLTSERFNNIAGSDVSDLTSDTDYPNNPDVVTELTSFESSSNIGNSFGQRISGFLHAPETGPYQFFLSANDSAELWLSNSADPSDRQLIAFVDSATDPQQWDAQASQSSSVVLLAAGQQYYIEALHKESNGADHLAVGWVRPSDTTIEVIDGQYLSPVEPIVKIFSDRPNVAEGSASPARFTITRDGGPNTNALAVSYSVSGDATNGIDYQFLSGTISIPAGSDSVDLVVNPILDSAIEGDESLIVELQPAAGYEVGLKSERTVNGTLQDNIVAPAGGTVLYDNQTLSDFIAFGGSFSTVTDPIFGSVIQGVIPTHSASFNSQLKLANSASIDAGDLLLLELNVRSVGGDGQIAAAFENGTTFEKSLFQGIPVTQDWTTIQIPFASLESYAVGEASFGLFLGYQSQTLQVADFKLTNYGPSNSLAPETDFRLNNINGNFGAGEIVPVSGQPFDFAYEVETTSVPNAFYMIQALENNDAAIANGDTLRIEFSLRALAGASPQVSVAIQDTAAFGNLFAQNFNPTSQWQSYSFDIAVTEDFAVDGLQTAFNVGFGLQTVQIGGFHWTNLSNDVDLADLPQQFPAATYGGRSGTDNWRADADTRIEAERKSDVTIIVNDSTGQPLDGAVVSVRQTEHDFVFGSAISAFGSLLDPNGNSTALEYQSEINRLFNTVVIENSLKWDQFINNRGRGIDAADFATDNDLFLRGHNIIWPSRNFMPDSVWAEYDTRVGNDGTTSANAWLKTTIEARFDDVLNTFDGQITEWDVVNELFDNNDALEVLGIQPTGNEPKGKEVVLEWFQRVRDFDPNINLTYNDYGIFTNNGGNVNHRANFDFWLGELVDASLLDVIGIQSHFSDASLTDISVLEGLITSYNTQFNTPIAITEFDLNSRDEQVQADYLRDYMTQVFSQSGVSEFVQWGFWEGAHYLPEAALYRQDFSIKPNGQAYEDLVFGNWWTDVAGTTESGQFQTSAFLGEYDIEVQYEGQTYSALVSVDDSGTSSVTVNLPVTPVQYAPVITLGAPTVSGNLLSTLTNSGTWAETQGESVLLSASLGEITQNADGTWSWELTPTEDYTNTPVTITGTDSGGQTQQITFNIDASVGNLGSGVAVSDAATGTGYIMYSVESVHSRFAAGVNPNNADHFIAVRFDGTNWEYNTDSDTPGQDWIVFTTLASDVLVADVDFSADTIASLEGTNTTIDGITAGYASGNLLFIADQWGGNLDDGEFEITGTQFTLNTPPPFLLGDSNQDGVVDFADIPAFISILQDGIFLEEADFNGDGVVNFADIPFFIELLIAQ